MQKVRVTPIDLIIIHEFYTPLKQTYPDNSNRQNYFLAACSLFFLCSDYINYNIFFQLRPYGDLSGIDKTSLDKYLKNSQCLQLRVVLHDAAVYIKNSTTKRAHVLLKVPWNCKNSLLGHLGGIIKLKKLEFYHLQEC